MGFVATATPWYVDGMRLILAIFVFQLSAACIAREFSPPRQVDERRAAAAGIRKIVSRHLRLYTDLPASDAVDSLPAVFDAAVPLWAKYFQVDPSSLRNWRMQGYLIEDRAKFAALELLPLEKPDFPNGFSNGYELWWMQQPSDYFCRHLMLHEGTHGFMYTQLGDTGPGWYMEGMAELFGTHRWHDGELQLRVMPAHRGEVPMWGRIKLVREATQPLALPTLLQLDKYRTFSTEQYAWCWALCEFLDSHPRWQEKFRELPRWVAEPKFNKRFWYEFRENWSELRVEWQVYVEALDYGYDHQRMTMQHKASELVEDVATVTVDADHGWQSTGWLLPGGSKYELEATGRFEISRDPDGTPWPCEPGGVTLEYHDTHPLGMLLGAWRTETAPYFSEAFPVGLSRVVTPPTDAVLYLRVNDSPAKLSDNRGTLDASIRSLGD